MSCCPLLQNRDLVVAQLEDRPESFRRGSQRRHLFDTTYEFMDASSMRSHSRACRRRVEVRRHRRDDTRSGALPASARPMTQFHKWRATADGGTPSSQHAHTQSAADPPTKRDCPTPSHASVMRSLILCRLCPNPRSCCAFVGLSWNHRASQLVDEGVGSSQPRGSGFSICAGGGFFAESQAPLDCSVLPKVCSHRRRKTPIVAMCPSLRASASQKKKRRSREQFGQRSKG